MKKVHRCAGAFCIAVASVLLVPIAVRAQVPKTPLPNYTLRTPPELEVYAYRVYDDSVGVKDALKMVVAVRNNGQLPGSFDYALGSTSMDAVWWRATGSQLDEGERYLGTFNIPYSAVANRLGTARATGWQKTCLGVYLVKQGSTDAWTDADNPNHRKQACFYMYRATR